MPFFRKSFMKANLRYTDRSHFCSSKMSFIATFSYRSQFFIASALNKLSPDFFLVNFFTGNFKGLRSITGWVVTAIFCLMLWGYTEIRLSKFFKICCSFFYTWYEEICDFFVEKVFTFGKKKNSG